MGRSVIDEVFQELQQPLMLYALSLTRNQADAEDLVQESFYRLLLTFDRVVSQHYRPWLFRVLKNIFLDRQRKNKHFNEASFQFQLLPEDVPDPLADYLVSEKRQEVYRVLKSLDQEYQEILFYYYFLELSIKEISQLNGMTTGQIKTRLFRGRARLRKELEQHG